MILLWEPIVSGELWGLGWKDRFRYIISMTSESKIKEFIIKQNKKSYNSEV